MVRPRAQQEQFGLVSGVWRHSSDCYRQLVWLQTPAWMLGPVQTAFLVSGDQRPFSRRILHPHALWPAWMVDPHQMRPGATSWL